jgi:hypothetical protein
MLCHKYLTPLFLCLSFALFAQENINQEEELEILGSLYWYGSNCKNTSEKTNALIVDRIWMHGITIDIEDNDFIANGMNMAWFAGCDRILEEIVTSGNSQYLICSKTLVSEDGDTVLDCKTN